MLDLVVVDGKARGIVVRDLISGAISSHAADAVILATGGYANVLFLSTNARGSNATTIWRAYKRGAAFANPCYIQIHPTCILVSGSYQSKLTLMSESLRNDGLVWVPKARGGKRAANAISEVDCDYFLERKYSPHKPGADSESVLGGADAVEKTTWVVGDGTDPNARTPVARPPAVGRTGFNPLLWVIVLIAVLVALVYVLGVMR